MSVSAGSEMNDTDVKDADRGVSGSIPVDKSDRDDVVNEESRDVASGITSTVQTSLFGGPLTEQTAINGVDRGVSVNVHVFCSSVG